MNVHSLCLFVLTLCLGLGSARGFSGAETDGFSSAMTVKEALAHLEKMGRKPKILDERLILYEQPDGSHCAVSFTGKEGKAGIFQRSVSATFPKFVATLMLLERRHGIPARTFGMAADPTNAYSSETVTVVWNTGADQIQLEYNGTTATIRYNDRTHAKAFLVD